MLVLVSGLLSVTQATPDDATVYFNAGTEQYLQGHLQEAVESLEKARALAPEDKRIKNLLIKILMEGATQNHVSHNYRKEMEYLEKARAIAPDSPKVQEMYKLTSDLLGSRQEAPLLQTAGLDNKPAPEPARSLRIPPREITVPRTPKKEKNATATQPPINRGRPEARQHTAEPKPQPLLSREYVLYVCLYAAMLTLVCLLELVSFYIGRRRMRRIIKAGEDSARLQEEEKNKLLVELEKMKERVKYEHQAVEQLREELKERSRREDEWMTTQMEQRSRELEQQARQELTGRRESDDFLQQQEKKFMEYLGEESAVSDQSSPALESARERIAIMAENLYEYAPLMAADFLQKMAANENPLIRANVIHALGRIAKPETIEMLFSLFADPDLRVRREVLKALKTLNQKILSRAVFIDPDIAHRIAAFIEQEKQRGEWIM
jgi:tetratricopeptide (TPR) repeat protein